jgi:hypothetical protein
MKTGMIVVLTVVLAFALITPVSMAISEKEELTLRVQLNRERLARIEAQSLLMQRDYEGAKATLQTDTAKLQTILDKEKAEAGKKK